MKDVMEFTSSYILAGGNEKGVKTYLAHKQVLSLLGPHEDSIRRLDPTWIPYYADADECAIYAWEDVYNLLVELGRG